MQLAQLVTVSADVARTRSRLKKRASLVGCLKAARQEEVALVVDYLSGQLPQGRIGLGLAIVREVADSLPARDATLTLAEVDAVFARIAAISGKGSANARREALGALLSRATRPEQEFLARLILGELRQGALEGVLVEAIADAAGIDAGTVRRAVMLSASPADVAAAALADGAAGLEQFRLEPMSPVKPMLAQPADGIEDALQTLGEAALEYKLDGARVQIHRLGDDVRIFSRRLHDVTSSLPEVVDATLALPFDSAILDGEVIAMQESGRNAASSPGTAPGRRSRRERSSRRRGRTRGPGAPRRPRPPRGRPR